MPSRVKGQESKQGAKAAHPRERPQGVLTHEAEHEERGPDEHEEPQGIGNYGVLGEPVSVLDQAPGGETLKKADREEYRAIGHPLDQFREA